MTLAMAVLEETVRDADLRLRLDSARGSFGYEFLLRQCVVEDHGKGIEADHVGIVG
jgi:hypothetical protein